MPLGVIFTVDELSKVHMRCQNPLTQLVVDNKNGVVVRVVQGVDADGNPTKILRKYRREPIKNKRGEEMVCGAALWQFTASDPQLKPAQVSPIRERKIREEYTSLQEHSLVREYH